MKLKALLLTLLIAGFVTSIAVAGPPPGKGKSGKKSGAPALTATTTTTTTTGTITTTASKGKAGKVMLCHRTGSKKKPFVPIVVSRNAAKAHLKHGDLPMPASGSCPTTSGGGTTTTTTTGTTQTTTTATTTTTA